MCVHVFVPVCMSVESKEREEEEGKEKAIKQKQNQVGKKDYTDLNLHFLRSSRRLFSILWFSDKVSAWCRGKIVNAWFVIMF